MGGVLAWRDGARQQLNADPSALLVPALAVGSVALAAVTDPGPWWGVVLLVLAALVLGVWAAVGLPPVALTAGVMLAVGASQWTGELEPGLFLLSLLGVALTGWRELTGRVATLVLVAAVSPLAIMALQEPDDRVAGGIWVLGVLFPALLGAAFHRQEVLTAQLEATRRALVQQEVMEERQRIARDVHDLVGHGLSGMMLQITSARHVLGRDPDAAAEALDAATDVGRQSMHELRRTVASLREGGGSAPAPPPGLRDVAPLVETYRAAGLPVEYRLSGDHDSVDPVTGLTLHRIAQEALANASHHAPQSRTVVVTVVDAHGVTLEVETRGTTRRQAPRETDRPHYGLQGMRERAQMLGADFEAGATDTGWLVRCRVDLAQRRSPAEPPPLPASPEGVRPHGTAGTP